MHSVPPLPAQITNANLSSPPKTRLSQAYGSDVPRVLLTRGSSWAPGISMSYVFPTETFAFTNWVSEQRLKHLTSVDSATPPPAPAAAASLFLWVSALCSVLSEGSRGATASPWELGVGRLGFQATKASRLSRPVTD